MKGKGDAAMGTPERILVTADTPSPLEPPAIHRIQDADRQVEIRGFLEYRVSTETLRKPQWLELELWKICDGTGRYLEHIIGKSVLYHNEDSDCNTGIPMMAAHMPDDSEPCRKCNPKSFRSVPKNTVFDVETDRHKVEICDGRENERWPMDEYGIPLVNLEPDLDERGNVIMTAEEKAWYISAHEVIKHLRESWRRQPGGTLSAPAQRLLKTVAVFDPAIDAALNHVERV